MKQFATLLCLSVFLSPAAAEEEEGLSLIERGAQMLLEGLLQQMEPTLDDLQSFADEMSPAIQQFAKEMGPKLQELMKEVEDWSTYHPPELLPNGDIIMRKKKPVEMLTDPEDSIEL